ncbi:hypothetical protein J0910_11835 [Nocardiopsis sp. CNT-189]|uniref:flavoprotein n=1 Tax=Nocardiopsis oceanisediminis TaxID=2816862 RepID=UPI003B2FB01D
MADGSDGGAAVPKRLLLGVSGSIALLALPSYLYAFRAAGVEQIAAVFTRTAERMLPAAGMRAICEGVYTEDEHGRGHVALGRWADRMLVLPATAHTLGCLAGGLAPNLLCSVALAAECPAVLVPAMNPAMWRKAAVRRNVARLREDGYDVVDPLPGTTYEVATHSLVQGLAPPPPEEILRRLSPGPAGVREAG